MISLINEKFIVVKFRKTESQMVVTGGWGEEIKESCEFHVCKMKKFQKSASQQYQRHITELYP